MSYQIPPNRWSTQWPDFRWMTYPVVRFFSLLRNINNFLHSLLLSRCIQILKNLWTNIFAISHIDTSLSFSDNGSNVRAIIITNKHPLSSICAKVTNTSVLFARSNKCCIMSTHFTINALLKYRISTINLQKIVECCFIFFLKSIYYFWLDSLCRFVELDKFSQRFTWG